MKAKFLFSVGDVRIAPNSVVEVEVKDADHNNTWFIFPSSEIASRGLCLTNAGLLTWPAKAVLVNPRDVAINISAGEAVAVRLTLDNEGVEMENAIELNEDEEIPNKDGWRGVLQDPVQPKENPEGSEWEGEEEAKEEESEWGNDKKAGRGRRGKG